MTRFAPIRYQGLVAYPSQEQMRQAKQKLDFDFGDGNRLTEERECTHLQRITVRETPAQFRQVDEQTLRRFFDDLG